MAAGSTERVLRPLLVSRIACSLPGLVLAALALLATADPNVPIPRALGVAGVVLGLGLAVRGYRMRVVLRSDTATVHGQLWSRTIARPLVEPSDGGSIHWQDERGRGRWTPVTAFWIHSAESDLPTFGFVRKHNLAMRRRIRDWTR